MIRSRATLVLFAALLIATVAPTSARAASQVFVTGTTVPVGSVDGSPLAGPRADGEAVIWAGHDATAGLALQRLAPGGAIQTVGRLEPGVWWLTAEGGQLAYSRTRYRCTTDCRTTALVAAETRVGPVGGTYELIASCDRGAAECPDYVCGMPYVQLGGGSLLYQPRLCDGRLVVRDLASGSERAVEVSAWPHAIYGRQLATGVWREGEAEQPLQEVVVQDAFTGEEQYRVSGTFTWFALDETGRLVLYDRGSGQLSWATREEPVPHPLATFPPGFASVQVRRGVIALAFTAPNDAGHHRYWLVDFQGRRTSLVEEDGAGGWGFDGSRLAWASSPCGVAIIRVWDVRDAGPALAGGPCPAARVLDRTVRVDPEGRFAARVRCPEAPQLGCVGGLRIGAVIRHARGRTRRRHLGFEPYVVRPGKTESVPFKLSRAGLRLVVRHRRVPISALTLAPRRSGYDRQQRRRGRFTLRAGGAR